jgi:phage shock protein C
MEDDMKRLHLSATDKKLSGVCGGIGEYFDIDPTLVRLGWIVLTILTGIVPGIVGYIIAALVIPHKDEGTVG